MKAASALIVLAVLAFANADMYLHNPRGSNNRLDEARRDRTNANRMFDSQNNNRGGYNVGNVYYYTGSVLAIEWTNQHSCGDQNNFCEQILQYMCDDRLRDGASTNTIPENQAQCDNNDCNTDLEYGMHEDYNYYLNCKLRERNQGLYTADRNLQGLTARFTRQNNGGTRRGYECPEERDYYPYWHPTPWRDIAILTNDVTRCPYYQEESQNVKSRFACVLEENLPNNVPRNQFRIPITQEGCTERGGAWTEFLPDSRLSAPDCVEAQWSRDNHLGNTLGGYPIYYNWTIPDLPHENCALRIRYNISTADYPAWDGSINGSIRRQNARVYDGPNNRNSNEQISNITIEPLFNFEEAASRGYVFRQNPVVKIFPDPPQSNGFGLQLAINTNQFGRTFQDRSHSFAIRQKPQEYEDCNMIYNVNVRGKRGNIVQVYPGVEYDFVPNTLIAGVGSCIHFQWTGSNTNPNNNDGQGRAGTDRSNVVLLRAQNFDEGTPENGKMGHWGNSYPAHLDHNQTLLGLSRDDRDALASLKNVQYGGEMSELDDAGTYYDLGPRKVTQAGVYYYMCTRNNNFTNRSQKGRIVVSKNQVNGGRLGWNGGVVEVNKNRLIAERGALMQANTIQMEELPDQTAADDFIKDMTNTEETPDIGGNPVSKPVVIHPLTTFQGVLSGNINISIPVDGDASQEGLRIMYTNRAIGWSYAAIDTQIIDGQAVAQTNSGGIFIVTAQVSTGLIVGVVVTAVIVIILVLSIIGVSVYFVARPEKWRSAKENVYKTQMKVKRSFARQV